MKNAKSITKPKIASAAEEEAESSTIITIGYRGLILSGNVFIQNDTNTNYNYRYINTLASDIANTFSRNYKLNNELTFKAIFRSSCKNEQFPTIIFEELNLAFDQFLRSEFGSSKKTEGVFLYDHKHIYIVISYNIEYKENVDSYIDEVDLLENPLESHSEQNGSTGRARTEYLTALLGPLPLVSSYEDLIILLKEANVCFRREISNRLQPALIAKLQDGSLPHDTYEQKKELAKWVNNELKPFELAIKSPKTGQPASFKAKPGNHPKIGAFELKSEDSEGKDKTFTTSSITTLLENFELIDASTRREPLAEWHERVKTQPLENKRSK